MLYQDLTNYSYINPPPPDHPQLGQWIWGLFSAAYAEKQNLGIMDRWANNYRLFKSLHWNSGAFDALSRIGSSKLEKKLSVALFFANVMRTVANMVARDPIAQVVDTDGIDDSTDRLFSVKMEKWWSEKEVQGILANLWLKSEVMGITIPKFIWNPKRQEMVVFNVDPYCFFPSPRCPLNIQDAPYIIHAFPLPVEKIAQIYGVDQGKINVECTEQIFGYDDRGKLRGNSTIAGHSTAALVGGVGSGGSAMTETTTGWTRGEGMVIELWIRDSSVLYPDGIRVITATNRGALILQDIPNPNINISSFNLSTCASSFAWGRFPFAVENAYQDLESIWGFSAAEQVGDLNRAISTLVTKWYRYAKRMMFPPLVVEAGCGIPDSAIRNVPNLILRPTRPRARIEFIPIPSMPRDIPALISTLERYHDRGYQIEQADRGERPTGIIAASAIQNLKDSNAVLMQHKIRAIERITREIGRWQISFLQNFSVKEELVSMDDTPVPFRGVNFAGRKFNYLVEAGSTLSRTSEQEQAISMQLYQMGVIDRRALLEDVRYKNRDKVLERVSEGQLGQAMQVLVQAGMPEETAQKLYQYLMVQGQGVGGSKAGGGSDVNMSYMSPQRGGTPRSQQGQSAIRSAA